LRPSITQYRAVLRRVVQLSPPGIGIDLGLDTAIADEGVPGYAALSSATLRDVNALLTKYLPLVQAFTLYTR
jgi:hypothetical protein